MLALKAPVNALFMYGLFGLPELGGAGAGVGNAVLAWFGLIFYAGYFFKGAHYKPMHAKRWFGPSFDALKEQLRIGLPIGLSVFFEVSSFTLMAIFISRMGAVAVSAHQIVSNITSTLYMVPLSIGIAASVLVSQCLGAGFPDAAERITRRSLAVTVAIAATACCLLFIFSHFIISIYTTDIAVMQIAGTLILCGVIYHTFDAAQSVSSFILRGYKIAWVPMIVSGVALWGVGLFGGYNLAFRESFLGAPLGPLGFWIACACGLILSGITLVSFALYHARSVKLATQKA
jgi:MATE family multidrug resistance protein